MIIGMFFTFLSKNFTWKIQATLKSYHLFKLLSLIPINISIQDVSVYQNEKKKKKDWVILREYLPNKT